MITRYTCRVATVNAPVRAVLHQWRPPAEGRIKANFDAYIGGDGVRGLGVVFRDHEGSPKAAAVRKMRSNMGVEEAELSAACFALEVAGRMGYEHIHLEGDAQVVIHSLQKHVRGLSPIHSLYDYLISLSSSFDSFSCSSVRRSGNTVAHYVARWDTGMAYEKICMEPFPQGFLALVDIDLI